MEWLRNHSFLSKNSRTVINTEEECDPQACYDSFKEHWHQALKILQRVQQLPSHDDVLGVVNHLEQMVTLLLYDMKRNDRLCMNNSSQCLDYLLTENILDKLFEWSMRSGKYKNAVRCEQLKLYEMLIAQSRELLLKHDAFVKPMLKLLNSCHGEVFSIEIEKLLVDLLNQLSTLLVQNIGFIKLFFQCDRNVDRFIIFSLLIPFVHREDSIGMRARDALLLCMTLSIKNKEVAIYISEHSNFSVLVASGLSGLYSVLPNSIDDIGVPDWHRFTPDDVKEIKGLLTFVTSLDFSNAVAQIAHPMIRQQLQEFLYRGFLIPVLGAALLQINILEQVAATAYLELIIRTVTEPGLLHAVLRFLLVVEYDGDRLLNILINRIDSERQLCLVSLALFESLIDLNCEDLMLELSFKHLQPCFQVLLSQRKILLPLDLSCSSFEKLLLLAPNCCRLPDSDVGVDGSFIQWNHFKHSQSLYGKYYAYLCDARNKIGQCQRACSSWSNSYNGDEDISCNSEEKSDSLISLERSSGYESFNMNLDDIKEESEWLVSTSKGRRSNAILVLDDMHLETPPCAGPFLTILMEKLRNFLSNSIYVNLHLTGIISRLAAYPQPLLRAYLLEDNMTLPPNVPSIFEILNLLKHQVDEAMNRYSDKVGLIRYAQDILVDREVMLVNLRRYHTEKSSAQKPAESNEPFQRNGPKRRSLNIPSITSMFGRRPSQVETSMPLVSSPEELQFNLIYPKFNEGQHVALCAVLLDEWVKELAALAQEHTVAQLATSLS
ncbi:FHIP family protein AGAP011705 [Cylas formicarius]|uniref:FHIP family protein AGAP011705 n=1 Tax=Cylas formicarius TaxID=197179 RepID=UPI0029588C1F|nr:FHIP family protein AGAP011705 [Cylas formicarius]